MNLEETITLIEALKSAGAVHFKSRDFEVQLRRGKVVKSFAKPPKSGRVAPPPQASELPLNPADTAKAEELISTLKLRDEELMNVIFPDGAGG